MSYRTPGETEAIITLQGLKAEQLPERVEGRPYRLEFLSPESALLVIYLVPGKINNDYFNFLQEYLKELKQINNLSTAG